MLLPSLIIITLALLAWLVVRTHPRRTPPPPPPSWRTLLEQHVRWFDGMTPVDQDLLIDHTAAFIADKRFEACGDLDGITETMKVVIAGMACSLVLHRPHPHYPLLRSILVYPGEFDVPTDPTGLIRADPFQTIELVDSEPEPRIGESWDHGSVVLAWDSVVRAIERPHDDPDDDNVVLHEFAHQLDEEGQGVPLLASRDEYHRWHRVFTRAFEDFQARVDQGRATRLDPYAATNPAEFFAVATETCFENSARLRSAYPEVHRLLQEYYGMAHSRGGGSPAET